MVMLSFVSSCTYICPPDKQRLASEQYSFKRAFDHFQETNRINEFQQFIIDYPDSDWATRAITIILYSQELDKRKAQVGSLREVQGQQQETLAELKAMNKQLTLQLEQFKGLLIQMEKRQQ